MRANDNMSLFLSSTRDNLNELGLMIQSFCKSILKKEYGITKPPKEEWLRYRIRLVERKRPTKTEVKLVLYKKGISYCMNGDVIHNRTNTKVRTFEWWKEM